MISNGDCDASSNPDSNSHAHADGNSDPASDTYESTNYSKSVEHEPAWAGLSLGDLNRRNE
jgi:hypothetical protein